MEEEQEEGPVVKHLYKERKPLGPQSTPSPEEVGLELQRKAEAKKRWLVLRRKVKDKTNKASKGCGITFLKKGKIPSTM